jgi:hypothetical protein
MHLGHIHSELTRVGALQFTQGSRLPPKQQFPMAFEYWPGTRLVCGLKEPGLKEILIQLDPLSQRAREAIMQSEKPIQYAIDVILKSCPEKAARATFAHFLDYNRVLRLYQCDPSVLTWTPLRVKRALSGKPDPLATIADEVYSLPRERPSPEISIRALAAVRRYMLSQDPFDLDLAPDGEIEAVMRQLPFMAKVGAFWVPVKRSRATVLTRTMDAPRDAMPSFSILRSIVRRQVCAVIPDISSDGSSSSSSSSSDVEIILPEQFLTDATLARIRAAGPHIVFITKTRQEYVRLTSVRHYAYTNLTYVQGYAAAILAIVGLEKKLAFRIIIASSSSSS